MHHSLYCGSLEQNPQFFPILPGLSRETEPIGYISIYRKIYLEGLTYMIIEVKKTYDLLAANWRPNKVSGAVLVQTQRSENQGSQCGKSQYESEDPKTRGTDGIGPGLSRVWT